MITYIKIAFYNYIHAIYIYIDNYIHTIYIYIHNYIHTINMEFFVHINFMVKLNIQPVLPKIFTSF